jgi:hypothetical protein
MRPRKKTRDVLPLPAVGRTATQQLPSCCRGRSRPSRQSPPPDQARASYVQGGGGAPERPGVGGLSRKRYTQYVEHN